MVTSARNNFITGRKKAQLHTLLRDWRAAESYDFIMKPENADLIRSMTLKEISAAYALIDLTRQIYPADSELRTLDLDKFLARVYEFNPDLNSPFDDFCDIISATKRLKQSVYELKENQLHLKYRDSHQNAN